jgi:hypothetical protein
MGDSRCRAGDARRKDAWPCGRRAGNMMSKSLVQLARMQFLEQALF